MECGTNERAETGSGEQFGGVLGEIGDDEVGTGTDDCLTGLGLHHRLRPETPACNSEPMRVQKLAD